MKEKSWGCTVITQISLCLAAYIALNIGRPQQNSFNNLRPTDTFFISVGGGFRPVQEQTLLLKQMVKVAKTYKAQFVVDVSELGQTDQLMQNATLYPELQSIPWYTTGSVEEQEETYFLKKIKLPYGQTLDIIAVDTLLFQDPSSVPGNDQIHWLMRTLNESDSDWRIVVGFHQLVSSENKLRKSEGETSIEPLQKILLHYGVDAYMSREICSCHVHGSSMDKTPYLTALNQNLVTKREARGGFLLHQVSSSEMVTFFVKTTGEVEHQVSFQQRGKAVM